MPKRIEHEIIDGIEKKLCGICKGWKPLDAFNTTGDGTWDGLFYACKECELSKRKSSPLRNAHAAWRAIVLRVEKRADYQEKGIRLACDRKDFLEWYQENWFKGCLVDRIDNAGDYELSNMQLISLEEHNYKMRADNLAQTGVIEPGGMRYCYGCKTIKPADQYYRKDKKISKINPLGLDENCKECCRKARIEHYRRNHA